MQKLEHELLTSKYTEVFHEPKGQMKHNAPHHFIVKQALGEQKILSEVHFQEGPILEEGVNGVCNEDLIGMVLTRLEHFQQSNFACSENQEAILKLEEALTALRRRTTAREKRGVEGTHVV